MNNLKDKLLFQQLSKYFLDDVKNIENILPIISGKDQISLRLLDWFVTNYSKYNIVQYPLVKNNKKIQFIVHLSYKSQLKAFSKKLFDPFCRRKRIYFTYDKIKNKQICTTIGQLNFFKWALENNILIWLRKNIQIIENDMNAKEKKLKRKNCKTNQMNKHEVVILLTFN